MLDEYIDVGDEQRRHERALAAFKENAQISDRNKELVQRFLRDALLGKTNPGSAKKRVSVGRLNGYLNYLNMLLLFVQKDLEEVTETDMELFVEALDQDKIRSRRPRAKGRHDWSYDGGRLSASYKVSVKQGIKKFYKWLWGDNKEFPKLVEWIETIDECPEVSALTEVEVSRMIDYARSIAGRALIQLLFDGGFRIGELLNVRLRHVTWKSFDGQHPERRCFVVRIPFSKTKRRTVALPMKESAKWLSLWLEEHPADPKRNEDGVLDAADVNMPLFPMTAKRARGIVRRVGRKALGKRVYPHLLRHTSATYWCNRIPYFKFCKRFGWTMTSKMPQRYIDREGIDELEIARVYYEETGGGQV